MKSNAPCKIKAAANLSISFSLLLTFISNSLDKLKAPTVDNLSSHKDTGISIFFEILIAVSFAVCADFP